jgi:hypothetical protein
MMSIILIPMILGLIVFAGALIGGAFVVILDVELIQRRRKKKEELQSSLSRPSSAREKR